MLRLKTPFATNSFALNGPAFSPVALLFYEAVNLLYESLCECTPMHYLKIRFTAHTYNLCFVLFAWNLFPVCATANVCV